MNCFSHESILGEQNYVLIFSPAKNGIHQYVTLVRAKNRLSTRRDVMKLNATLRPAPLPAQHALNISPFLDNAVELA